jgi:hypothetical protein
MRFSFGGDWHGWGAGLGAERATYDDADVIGSTLLAAGGGEVTFWDAPTAGNQYTDLLDDNGSSVYYLALSAGTDTYRVGGLPRFQGPDGVPVLYAEAGDAPRMRLVAGDAHLASTDTAALIAGMLDDAADLDTVVDAAETAAGVLAAEVATQQGRVEDLQDAEISAVGMRPSAATNLTTSTWTTISFGAEQFDTHNGHSTVTNTSRYVAAQDGYYLLMGMVVYEYHATGLRYTRWHVNGIGLTGGSVIMPAHSAGSGGLSVPAMTTIVALEIGDYVELQGHQSSGTTLATEDLATHASNMSVYYLRPL